MKLEPWPQKRPPGAKPRSKQKQIQVYVSPDDWLRLRRFAAHQHKPITEIVRQILRPAIAGMQVQSDVD